MKEKLEQQKQQRIQNVHNTQERQAEIQNVQKKLKGQEGTGRQKEQERKEKRSGNLTEGPILRVLARLALPIMATSFLSTAYSITDMAWIGVLGSQAVAGVGVGGMYVWLSQGLAALARMGGQVNVAQAVGRQREDLAREYSGAAVQMVLLFGLLFGSICLIFTNPLVGFFGVEDAVTVTYAKGYLKITCGLIVFSYVNYVLTGLFTARGDSATPLKANVAGLVINMIFDPLLILGAGPFPRLEVVGAAVATVGAQMVVTGVLVAHLLRHGKKQIPIFQRVKGSRYRAILRIGVPTAVQTSLYCMISMVLTRMVAVFGAGAVATQRVGGQIESVCWNTAEGFGAAMNAFVGQNYGARKMERVKKGYRLAFFTVLLEGLAVTAAFVLFPEPLSRLFFHEAEVIQVAVDYLIIVGLSEAFMAVELMAIGAISGFGNTRLCSIVSASITALRIPLAMILSRTPLGLNGIWWALTITSMTKGIVLHITFWQQWRKRNAQM